MKVTVKLYALLSEHLPDGAKNNQFEAEFPDRMIIDAALSELGLPGESCHLVLVNGVYIGPIERGAHKLADGDALAVWPPIAGG